MLEGNTFFVYNHSDQSQDADSADMSWDFEATCKLRIGGLCGPLSKRFLSLRLHM